MKAFLFSSLFLTCITGGLYAQNAGSGAITGTITDPSGSVIPAATVVVHNSDTGADQSLSTNSAGIYAAQFLQPGHYDVTASKTGFTKTTRQGLTVEVGRSLTIDFFAHGAVRDRYRDGNR